MPDPAFLISLAQDNPRGFALLALYLVLSGLVSGLLARRSQVDAWAESRPRLAGALKLLRSVGLDPWIFVQGVSLLFRGKFPDKLKAAQAEAKAKAEPKRNDTIKPPPPRPPSTPPLVAMLCLLLLSCGGSQPQPNAVAALAPVVCQAALLQAKLNPAEVERVCADSALAARLATQLTEVVIKAVAEAQQTKADIGPGPGAAEGGTSGAAPAAGGGS
jgi:hypothetical protein